MWSGWKDSGSWVILLLEADVSFIMKYSHFVSLKMHPFQIAAPDLASSTFAGNFLV